MSPSRFSVVVVSVALATGAATAQGRLVALTFDDLPANSTRGDLEIHRAITTGLLDALAGAGAPAIGFVNENKLEEDRVVEPERVALLEAWLDAGHDLGNHSYSHPSLFTTPLADYQRDVLAGERQLRPLLDAHDRRLRYFRHPFLNTGPDVATRDAFTAFLGDHGYRVAPVTIDNDEWIYARAYDHALDRGEAALVERLKADYLDYMARVFRYYEQQSEAFLGRSMRHVLLLHANRLNADAAPELLAGLTERGYGFVSLDEALQDPAYELPDSYAGRGGITWLHRWALTAGRRGDFFAGEPAAPDWVRDAAGVD